MKIELEVTDLSPENRVDKFQKAIKALSEQFGVPATIEQKDHNKEEFPFRAQEDLYQMYKNEFGIIMDNLYSRICSTLGLRPASTFQKAIDPNAPKLGKEIIWNPETGKEITQKDLDRLLREVDKFMNRNVGPMQQEFTISQAAVAKIIANLKKTSSLDGVRNIALDDIRYEDKPWEYYNTYPKLAEAFPGSQERLEFRERVVGNYIQDINDSSRKKIRDTLDQGFLAGKTKSEISQDLFDNFGDLNKNWDRIVDTEGVNIFNAEFIAEEKKDTTEGEPLYFIRREFMDDKTCSFCEQANEPIIARWSEVPLQDENIDDPVASIALWEGKTNYGVNRADWQWAEGPNHPNCFSDDTEVLTDHGWKLFKNVLLEDKIMSINPETKDVDYLNHKGLISYDYDGDMVHFTGRNYDSLVTPEHNCLTSSWSGNKYYQSKAKDLIGKDIRIPRSGAKWAGDSTELERQARECNLDPIVYAKLWGWFLSEGNVRVYGKRHEIKLSQKFTDKIISDTGMQSAFRIAKDAIYVFDRAIVSLFSDFGGVHAEQKYIPLFLKNSTSIYLKAFLHSFMLGDGTIREKVASKKAYGSSCEKIVRTSSPIMMADLTEIIVKVGLFCSVNKNEQKGKAIKHRNGIYVTKTDCYNINVTKSKFRHYHKEKKYNKLTGLYSKEIELVKYNGMVYDVELEKWHFLLVKRNGKLTWSGNCRGSWQRYYPEIGDFEL